LKKAHAKVGIVMLLYNRADVAVPCLQSLAAARSNTEWELFLLDNGSRPEEAAAVRSKMSELVAAGSLTGVYVRSETNLGFPAGNNVGIRRFLEREDVTHLCLLNSDVVVPDHWLDRLLEVEADAVGPVTNACGNEQTIPGGEMLKPGERLIEEVDALAAARHERHRGHRVDTDFLGFFCFLAHAELFASIGLLDERFGRGAYEDDDYCLRIQASGYRMCVARDVYVHHWGTASFSQVPARALNRSLRRNRRKLELKHGLEWKDRRLRPLLGLRQDLEFLARSVGGDGREEAEHLGEAFLGYIERLLAEERTAASSGGLLGRLRSVGARGANRWRRSRLAKLLQLCREFVLDRPVVVLGRWYPRDEDRRDGYFQRVLQIDRLLSDHCRIYVRTQDVAGGSMLLPRVSRKAPRAYELGVRRSNPFHVALAALIVLWSGRMYVHSVLRFGRLCGRLYGLARTRVFDIHGVVPEEFLYHGDEANSRKYGELERLGLERASLMVVVTEAMAEHLRAKYGTDGVPPHACVTNVSGAGRWRPLPPERTERNGVIYAGGLHRWQQVDAMLDYVHELNGSERVTFLVTDVNEVRRRYHELFGEEFPGELDSVPAEEVARYYDRHAFGLVLREDVVVNTAACPTKLVEYLQHGLVPIVDTAHIGDFERLGYRYVPLGATLPPREERERMARVNHEVLRKMHVELLDGSERVRALLGGRPFHPPGASPT